VLFRSGYDTLHNYLANHNKDEDEIARKRALSLASFELVRLKHIGFIHGDLIRENIMYNPDYKYITDDDNNKGRALLIDFGRTLIDKEELRKQEQNWLCENWANGNIMEDHRSNTIVYEDAGHIQRFYEPYTFIKIYSERLNATLKFRMKMIARFKDFIKDFIKDYKNKRTEYEKAELLKSSHITLEKINNFIYPFVYPTITLFSEEFTDCYNNSITEIFVSKFEEIQRFQDMATRIHSELKTLVPQRVRKRNAEDLRYGANLVNLLRSLIEDRNERKRIRRNALLESSQSSSEDSDDNDIEGGRRLVNYDKKHKVYNKRFSHSLRVNQYNARIRNTLKIKYRQTKKSKPKKSKPKKSKRKKSKLTKRKPTKSTRKK